MAGLAMDASRSSGHGLDHTDARDLEVLNFFQVGNCEAFALAVSWRERRKSSSQQLSMCLRKLTQVFDPAEHGRQGLFICKSVNMGQLHPGPWQDLHT